ncbi:MAG: aminopeptidase P family protein [Acidobacteriaceae bacterium]|nr:aminopeptidase P family protein [Acidobacteriaceae bacterium]MBV9781986.1 aminopeptidase P family protein [Acidobacteriaceae bacterium]
MVIEEIQEALREATLDAWLFFDHHRRDPLAYRILGIPNDVEATRRWYYLVPAQGEPRKLVHRIESSALNSVPGQKQAYSSWSDQQEKLHALLRGCSRIAMQYSPKCAIPYVSLVDAGTVELVRGFGVEIVSAADLIQRFEARWNEEQLRMHLEAGRIVDRIRREAFEFIGARLKSMQPVTEFDVQQFIVDGFSRSTLMTTHGPIVAANANASDPHYEPNRDKTAQIRPRDLVLIDLWAKLAEPNAVYYDVTWTGYCGETVPDKIQNIFEIVKTARKRACSYVIDKVSGGVPFTGYEVDDAARNCIEAQGFGAFFFHRTGHSIGTDVHGNGANMDNLESHDDRRVIPRTCFSIEPGIYLPEFGIRSEVNMYVDREFARVTGEEQEQLVRI